MADQPDEEDAVVHGHIVHAPPPDAVFIRRLLTVALVAVLALVLWQVSLVAILTFGGVLVAIILRSLADPLHRFLKIPQVWALLIVTAGLIGLAVAFFNIFGTLAAGQFAMLGRRIPEALIAARQWLNDTSLGGQILAALPDTKIAALRRVVEVLPLAGNIAGRLGEVLLVLVVGIYFALDPKIYVNGVVRLVPAVHRIRARQILDTMGSALHRWLIGMSLDMLLTATMIFIGMWIAGVPLPLVLAVLSGVAVFVPYIGPAIAMVPGLLLALSVSPHHALYAGLVYLIALTIEGNISQPLLQKKAVSIPPVVNLLAILVFSPLFGLWGAILATPLSVAMWVLVKLAYIEDVLHDGRKAPSGPALP
jgi:predicted PurR-regulated permease PerM